MEAVFREVEANRFVEEKAQAMPVHFHRAIITDSRWRMEQNHQGHIQKDFPIDWTNIKAV